VALGRIIAPWAVKIAEFFDSIVKIILTIVENVRNSLHELGTCCREGYRIWSSCGEETAHSPSLPFSRCEAMGEGGRRPDEGSFPKSVAISTSVPAEIKEPSPALRAPSPILADGRGGKLETERPPKILICDCPTLAGRVRPKGGGGGERGGRPHPALRATFPARGKDISIMKTQI
jgi:hypothetical protein